MCKLNLSSGNIYDNDPFASLTLTLYVLLCAAFIVLVLEGLLEGHILIYYCSCRILFKDKDRKWEEIESKLQAENVVPLLKSSNQVRRQKPLIITLRRSKYIFKSF